MQQGMMTAKPAKIGTRLPPAQEQFLNDNWKSESIKPLFEMADGWSF